MENFRVKNIVVVNFTAENLAQLVLGRKISPASKLISFHWRDSVHSHKSVFKILSDFFEKKKKYFGATKISESYFDLTAAQVPISPRLLKNGHHP